MISAIAIVKPSVESLVESSVAVQLTSLTPSGNVPPVREITGSGGFVELPLSSVQKTSGAASTISVADTGVV